MTRNYLVQHIKLSCTHALQAGRPFRSKETGKMGYEDFVWFIMSEEDKSSDMALDYWFKCCDLDGDGCLQANEMLVSRLAQLSRFSLKFQSYCDQISNSDQSTNSKHHTVP